MMRSVLNARLTNWAYPTALAALAQIQAALYFSRQLRTVWSGATCSRARSSRRTESLNPDCSLIASFPPGFLAVLGAWAASAGGASSLIKGAMPRHLLGSLLAMAGLPPVQLQTLFGATPSRT